MCLYPKLIKNRKYISNKKNKGIIPTVKDNRTLLVPVGCNKCMECKKQKARQWSVRLQEEIRTNKTGQYVTLTLNTKSLIELSKEIEGLDGYERENEIITLATRRFLERWRKKYKISIKHWLVTELGGGRTEHIHLHGIIWINKYKHNNAIKTQYEKQQIEDITKIWKYGYVYIGDYVNETTVNYCVKYVTKTDIKHKEYNAKILTSAGIGSNYINRQDAERNKYKPKETKETYTTREGIKLNLPIYYRNKLYTEEQRENLWLEKLDKQERWVNGQKISIKDGEELYYKALQVARQKNNRLGYGDDKKNWSRIKYENDRRNINFKKRMKTLDNDGIKM